MAGGYVRRDRALALVRPVSRQAQDRINERRRQLELDFVPNPIIQEDYDLFHRTIMHVLEE